jgi:glucokinase
MREALVAADVGASKTLVALAMVEPTGWAWLGSARRFTTPGNPHDLVAMITQAARDMAEDQSTFIGAAVAIPGPVDRDRGILVHLANLGWRDVPFATMLSDSLGAPVSLDDDARLGAVGEWASAAGQGCRSLAFVTVSSGIGCGLILDGNPWPGSHGLAGEFGHIVVDDRGPRCGCGNRGCIEAYAGGFALARAARRSWPNVRLADGSRSPRTPAELFRMARRGDHVAARIVDNAANALAIGLAAIAAVADPDLIVVGGSVALGQRRWLRTVAARSRARCLSQTGKAMRVMAAGLDHRSALAGAAELAAKRARLATTGTE